MTSIFVAQVVSCVLTVASFPGAEKHSQGSDKGSYDIDRCVNAFTPAGSETTRAGYQYWFADTSFLDGRTLKLSVVRPGSATHRPHVHEGDEFFFVLEGRAEFFLAGQTRTVGPYTSIYCPPRIEHGIRNAGNSELKYLVFKKYDLTTSGVQARAETIDVAKFHDSAHHWYDIRDEDREITPLPGQKRYDRSEIAKIADNILRYQKSNGGWPKNYDMRAILTDEQQRILGQNRGSRETTFDNGATHSHVQYLAEAYTRTQDARYREACLKGIEFILKAQLENGGWQQFYPDTAGYRRYITFNDGAMIGVMKVLSRIVEARPEYAFVDSHYTRRVQVAFKKGLECILKCQMKDEDGLTAWCQQHDDRDLRPRPARTFEPAAVSGMESAEIVLFLMSLPDPDPDLVAVIQGAVRWFERSRISGVRVKEITARHARYVYHETDKDRLLVTDPAAPDLWARYYEIGTNVPLFCNRDGKAVYSLAEVERERRTGYGWYTDAPSEIFSRYPAWQFSYASATSAPGAVRTGDAVSSIPDTSFTTWSAWQKILREFPEARPAEVPVSPAVQENENIVYTAYGYRHLSLDLFVPAGNDNGPFPGVIIIHGGGWRSGSRQMEIPMARTLAAHGYAAAVVEYRLSGEAKYPAGVHDLKAAIRWMRAHASEYGIDSSRLAVMGGSAGGTLAVLLGATGDRREFEGAGTHAGFSSAVQAVIDIDGVVDFTDSAESGKDSDPTKPSAGKLWFGSAYSDRPDLWREASAVNWATSAMPPIMFVNSALDRFHAGRDPMIAKLNTLGVYSEVHSIPNTPHPFWLMHPWFEETEGYVVGFLDRVLKR
jgi:PelA/Pel-15E family pectate lyase